MADGNPRVRAVDVLRGLTVLGIIAIHARISVDWFGHRHLIDRSVPCFLVLMGVSSELWRRQHAPKAKLAHIKAYLVATARRLVLPYWAWLLLLLPIALAAGNGPERASLWLLAPLGYVPWAGPAWLITAVALLSVAVPVLQLLITRLGPLPTAAIALAITVWSHLHAFAIIGVLRVGLPLPEGKPALFLFWIFAPAYLWHVAAGLWLGRVNARVDATLFSLCVLALVWGHWGLARGMPPLSATAARAVLDVPLSIVLLGAAQYIARMGWLAVVLAHVGRAAWGVYLGHLLLFIGCELYGQPYQHQALPTRVVFFLALTAGALLLATVGRRVRALAARRLTPALSR